MSEVSHFATIDSLQKLKKMGAAVFLSVSATDLALIRLSEKGGFVAVVFADMYSVNSAFNYF